MTKAEAKKWCIKKWEWIVSNDGKHNHYGMLKDIPALKKFGSCSHYCAYCYYTNEINRKKEKADIGCHYCPLAKVAGVCSTGDGIYSKWANDNTMKNAQAMLDIIRRS